MPSDRLLAEQLLGRSASRLIRTVDRFHGPDWSAPSLLPGWTRAHVVAHLALNSEAMARVLHGLVADDRESPLPMYDSDQKRDHDIRELATADSSHIRARLLAGTTNLQDAIASVPEHTWETRVERTPGGRTLRAASFPGMRLREIEIHHVDLDAGYSTHDWSHAFAEHALDAMSRRLDPQHPFEVRPLDSQRTWVLGPDDSEYPVPVVTGPVTDLAWWLTGRPAPDSLSCSRGELPEIGVW